MCVRRPTIRLRVYRLCDQPTVLGATWLWKLETREVNPRAGLSTQLQSFGIPKRPTWGFQSEQLDESSGLRTRLIAAHYRRGLQTQTVPLHPGDVDVTQLLDSDTCYGFVAFCGE